MSVPGRFDARLAALLSRHLDDVGSEADSLGAVLGAVALVPGLAGLAEQVRQDPALRAEAIPFLSWLVEDGEDALGNANDVAVAALVDALCRAGVRPGRLEARLPRGHGLWWGSLALSAHHARDGGR